MNTILRTRGAFVWRLHGARIGASGSVQRVRVRPVECAIPGVGHFFVHFGIISGPPHVRVSVCVFMLDSYYARMQHNCSHASSQ